MNKIQVGIIVWYRMEYRTQILSTVLCCVLIIITHFLS